ncbi:hypothetical protein C1N84_02450 [Pantoea sp. SGAir0418]
MFLVYGRCKRSRKQCIHTIGVNVAVSFKAASTQQPERTGVRKGLRALPALKMASELAPDRILSGLSADLRWAKALAALKAAAKTQRLHCYSWLAADRHQSN